MEQLTIINNLNSTFESISTCLVQPLNVKKRMTFFVTRCLINTNYYIINFNLILFMS